MGKLQNMTVSVSVIRSYKRFAVRRAVTLRGGPPQRRDGLMIELSTEGCRISNADSLAYAIEQKVTVELDDGEKLPGIVRWAHDGFVGVRFESALRHEKLARLLEVSRPPEYYAAVA